MLLCQLFNSLVITPITRLKQVKVLIIMLQSLVLNERHDVAVLTILSKGRLNNYHYSITVIFINLLDDFSTTVMLFFLLLLLLWVY